MTGSDGEKWREKVKRDRQISGLEPEPSSINPRLCREYGFAGALGRLQR